MLTQEHKHTTASITNHGKYGLMKGNTSKAKKFKNSAVPQKKHKIIQRHRNKATRKIQK